MSRVVPETTYSNFFVMVTDVHTLVLNRSFAWILHARKMNVLGNVAVSELTSAVLHKSPPLDMLIKSAGCVKLTSYGARAM